MLVCMCWSGLSSLVQVDLFFQQAAVRCQTDEDKYAIIIPFFHFARLRGLPQPQRLPACLHCATPFTGDR